MTDEPQEFGEGELSLVMPFVCVRSNGGPYDDESFAAGWEMGALSATLTYAGFGSVTWSIRRASLGQADLVAMDRGYTMTELDGIGITGVDDEWANVRFAPSVKDGDDS